MLTSSQSSNGFFGEIDNLNVSNIRLPSHRFRTEYGLGASIWTEDLDKADKISQMVQSGVVSVNNIVAFNPSSFWRNKEKWIW